MKAFFCPIFLLVLTTSYGQQQSVDVNNNTNVNALSSNVLLVVGGTPYVNTKFTSLVDGTPYFNDNWMKGDIVLGNDQSYSGLKLKLNLVDNDLLYLNTKGEEMVAKTHFKEIILTDTVLNKNYDFIFSSFINSNAKPEEGWYQRLSNGTAVLFKRDHKRLIESKPLGFATVEQRITSSTQLFILYNQSLIRVKKLKEIPALLSNKKEQLQKYISEKKLSDKKEEDFVSLINYYNKIVADK